MKIIALVCCLSMIQLAACKDKKRVEESYQGPVSSLQAKDRPILEKKSTEEKQKTYREEPMF